MAKKPTYEELERRVKELEKESLERKRAEEAMRESEFRFQTLFENAPIGIGVATLDGKILSFNYSATQITGYSATELEKINLRDIYLTPDHRSLLLKRFRKEGFVRDQEVISKRKDGTPYYASLNIIPFTYGGEDVLLTVFTDITERKGAEEAMRESEERYRMLVETMNDGLGVQDENGFVTYVNHKLYEMLGYSRDELIGHHVTEFIEETHEDLWGEQASLRQKGKLESYELVMERKDGQKIYTFVSPRVIFDENGDFKGSFAVITDITELKQAEQALKVREKELEIKTSNLEEANTALKVLLKRKDEDKTDLEEKVLSNIRALVQPYIEKLGESGLDDRQKAYLDILESNLKDIISPFSRKLSSKYLALTPAELRIANLIKQGKTSKEIAEFLSTSSRTIEVHRGNIRKKLGIKSKKANLRTHLSSLQ